MEAREPGVVLLIAWMTQRSGSCGGSVLDRDVHLHPRCTLLFLLPPLSCLVTEQAFTRFAAADSIATKLLFVSAESSIVAIVCSMRASLMDFPLLLG
jgi:hypothetical protein